MAERRRRKAEAEKAPSKDTNKKSALVWTKSKVDMGVYCVWDDVEMPKYATEYSACFDLVAYLGPNVTYVDTYNRLLHHHMRTITLFDDKRHVYIEPGESVLIPTGWIFNIPQGFKIAAYPRSGIALKRHLKLSNCTGIIDEDYTKQTMICIFNNSEQRQFIFDGDALAQAEIVPYYEANFHSLDAPPEQKSSRTGGFGHSGTNRKVKK